MDPAGLGPEQRSLDLERVAEETFDLVIIGGGVVGAGTALDAASRGLSVAIIEQRDWASGTSSRSSKLIHGGLRYLEQFDFGLVKEALTEQTLLLDRLAPHLVKPVPFLYPLTRRVWERIYVGAGTLLYDILAGRRALPRHRHLTRRGVLRKFPGLRGDRMVGGIQYWDAQVDDARHTMTHDSQEVRVGTLEAQHTHIHTCLLRCGASDEVVERLFQAEPGAVCRRRPHAGGVCAANQE